MHFFANVSTIRQPVWFAISVRALVLIGLLLGVSSHSMAQELPAGCGSLRAEGRFGPFDYRASGYIPETTYRSHKSLLFIVENAHFTPEVEALIRGKTGAAPGGDISYTLHAFPNHHRALISVAALSQKENTSRPSGTPYNVECWFSRAIAFKPDDNVVRLIYANFLVKAKRNDEAEQQLNVVAAKAGDNAFTLNNIGLIYFDMKNYDKALVHSHNAIALGLRIPTLPDKLKGVGKWTEPVEAVPAASATNPEQSASEPQTTTEQ